MPPVVVDPKLIKTFRDEAAFEAWLRKHHARQSELWVRMYKKAAGIPSIDWKQAVDVALCWGWIDGLRKSYDDESFVQRYTPRRPRSIWSQINRDNVARLIAAGRMTPHGLKHVEAAKADGRWQAAYAPIRAASHDTIPADLRAAIDADPRARAAFATANRTLLFALAFRTNNMKTPAGRARKIAELVTMLAEGAASEPRPKPSAANRPSAPVRRKKR